MKRITLCSGMLFALGLLGMASYLVRELIAAFILFSVGFAALFLFTLICVLAQRGAQGSATWLRIRAPQWNRAGRDWIFEFAHPPQGRHLWQRWTHRIPAPAAPSAPGD